MALIDPINFLDFTGILHLGFEESTVTELFCISLLEAFEKEDSVERIGTLDNLLPVYPTGKTHPLYWLAILWLAHIGLLEPGDRETEGVDSLLDLDLSDAGKAVLSSFREKKAAFS